MSEENGKIERKKRKFREEKGSKYQISECFKVKSKWINRNQSMYMYIFVFFFCMYIFVRISSCLFRIRLFTVFSFISTEKKAKLKTFLICCVTSKQNERQTNKTTIIQLELLFACVYVKFQQIMLISCISTKNYDSQVTVATNCTSFKALSFSQPVLFCCFVFCFILFKNLHK